MASVEPGSNASEEEIVVTGLPEDVWEPNRAAGFYSGNIHGQEGRGRSGVGGSIAGSVLLLTSGLKYWLQNIHQLH